MIEKLRYYFFSKSIQKALDMTERATRESVDFYYKHSNGYAEIIEKYKNSEQFEKDSRAKLAELTYTVDPTQVISIRGDQEGNPIIVYIGKDKMTIPEVKSLKEEVKWYRNSRLYRILQETPKSQAHEIMFKKAGEFEDMKGGKYMLLNLDVQDRIMTGIEKFDTTKRK